MNVYLVAAFQEVSTSELGFCKLNHICLYRILASIVTLALNNRERRGKMYKD
jgi:hypothetical protein